MKINEKSGILSRIFCHISDDMKTILSNFEPAKGFPELPQDRVNARCLIITSFPRRFGMYHR